MGIFAVNSSTTNLRTNSWYHFFIEMNKYFHSAKWKVDNYDITPSDIVLLFMDEYYSYDILKLPQKCKKIAIVKNLMTVHLDTLAKCDFIIFLNPYQKTACDTIAQLSVASIACPKHPTIEYHTQLNTDNFVFFGGTFTSERIVGLADRIKFMHGTFSSEIEFLLFPNYDGNAEIESSFKAELHKLEAYQQLKSRVIYVNGDVVSYNALKFRLRTALHSCLWSNGMPIEMMDDLLNERSSELIDVGINESSMLSLTASGNANIIVDEEIDYVSHFRCSDTFTFNDFAKTLKLAIDNLR